MQGPMDPNLSLEYHLWEKANGNTGTDGSKFELKKIILGKRPT